MKMNAGISSELPVKNWVWYGPDSLTDAAALWDPVVPPALTGQYAFHLEQDGEHLLLRDALGVNKLFYSIDSDGCVHSSNYLFDLRARRPASSIYSVPSGYRLQLCPEKRTLRLDKVRTLPFGCDRDAADVVAHAGRIRLRLDAEFSRIQRTVGDRPLYVTLSGGLDSSVIAAVARRYFPRLRALTFCMGEESASRVPGADLYYAQDVADSLGMPLDVVCVAPEEIASLLDAVLIYGQDWRPFNVHCGLVNAAIGAWLARAHPHGPRPVVLTGDTMNELLADYAAVTYGGEVHYGLPRLDAGRLRRFLVGGLDAGDREVGIFRHFGIDTIEAYACCADAYTALPEFFVEQPRAKQQLVEYMEIEGIPQCIYDRPKVRAQAGSSVKVGGTLACLIDRGVDAAQLAARFAALFRISLPSLGDLVRGGYYRFTSVYPEGAT